MSRILVTRFSAMGDVAMVASVLKEFQEQHEDTEIIMVSRVFFRPFFEGIPRLKFHAIDPKYKHKGISGLFSLFNELKYYKVDFIADLHNNLRSRFLDLLFKMAGYKIAILDKGRKEKKELTRANNKILKPLKSTLERYADVFRKLGFSLNLSHKLSEAHRLIPQGMHSSLLSEKPKIGVAAFAQHSFKVFPLHKMEQIISSLSEKGFQIILFGGGEKEKSITEKWAEGKENVISIVGKYSLKEELDIISHLDLMISMDSAGMHMASLVGTRCVSIWGATHPYAGFLGFGQQYEDCIQVDHPNRPSSIYGNKSCLCDGIEAIDLVSSEMLIEKIEDIFVNRS